MKSKKEYQPKTGESCGCRSGIERDNCPACEGTGMRIDFKAIRDRKPQHTPTPWKLIEWKYGRRIEGPNALHIVTMTSNSEDSFADAAYIVRAVNAHALLLRLAKQEHNNYMAMRQGQHLENGCDTCQAIAKAEGK